MKLLRKIGGFLKGFPRSVGRGFIRFLRWLGQKMRKHKVITAAAVLLLIAGCAALRLVLLRRPQEMAQTYEFIRTVTLERGELSETVNSTGTVESSLTSTVSYSSSGSLSGTSPKVAEVHVAVGDYVEAGDVIVTLDAQDIEESIEEELELMDERLAQAKEAYDEAASSYEETLDELEEAEEELAQAEENLSSAEEAYNSAASQISSYQDSYDEAVRQEGSAGLEYDNISSQSSSVIAQATEAQTALEQASQAYETARQAAAGADVTGAQTAVSQAQSDVQAAQAVLDSAQTEEEKITAEAALETAEAALTQAEQNLQEAQELQTELASAQETLDAAQANLEQLESSYSETISSYEQAQQAYEAAQEKTQLAQEALNNAKLSCSYDERNSAYMEAETAYETARSQLEQLETMAETALETMEQAEESYEEASESSMLDELYEQLENCSLTAETSGKVTSLNVNVGDTPSGTIATIQDDTSLKISITISEADINNVSVGMECLISSDATEGEIEGQLTQIDPITTQTGYFGAEVTVLTQDSDLKIGMNASVDIVLSMTEDCFMVPIDAVGNDEDGAGDYVYRSTGGSGTDMTFEKIYVTTGDSNDYYIEITADELREGDVIRASADLTQGLESTTTEDGDMSGFDFGGMGGMSGQPGGDMGSFSGGDMGDMGGQPGGQMGGGPQ